MTRFFVVLYLKSFYTTTSGDMDSVGEFYFNCNGQKYPDIGVIKMKANELFEPEPNPAIYTAVTDDDIIRLSVEVKEQDIGLDDIFIDQKLKYPIRPIDELIEIHDKKDRCVLKLVIKITETHW